MQTTTTNGDWNGGFLAKFGLPLIGLLLPFSFLEFLTRYLSRFEISLYEQRSFTLAYVLDKLPLLLPIFVVQAVASYFLRRSSQDIKPTEAREIRILVVLLCTSLTWIFAGQGSNPLFEADHQIDRWLLFGALIATAIRPSFLLLFWIFYLANYGQLVVAPGNHAWSSLSLPRQVIQFTIGAYWLRPLYKDRFPQFLRAGLLVLVATRYWPSGIEKIAMDWHRLEDLGNIVMASYAVGWLGFFSPATFRTIESGISFINPVLCGIVLLLECGVVILLLSRRLAAFLLSGLILFHVGVTALMGTFFFHWIIIDVILVYSLVFMPNQWQHVFSVKSAFLCALLVVSAWLCAGLPGYAWIDLPVVEHFQFDLIDEEGTRWSVSPNWFAPYFGTAGAMNLSYLSPRPQFGIFQSTTHNVEFARDIQSLQSLQEFEDFEANNGSERFYSKQRKDKLIQFMKRFVPRRARMRERTPRFFLPAPRIRNYRRDGTRTVPSTGIRYVQVFRAVSFRSEGGLEQGTKELVLEIDLSDQ